MTEEEIKLEADIQRVLALPQTDSRFMNDAINCPHFDCSALAETDWQPLAMRFYVEPRGPVIGRGAGVAGVKIQNAASSVPKDVRLPGLFISKCKACGKISFWFQGVLIYPKEVSDDVPEPNKGLTTDILKDYLEASEILDRSPRGAAALLRLCVQKIVNQLVPGKQDLNEKIGILVKNGLREDIKIALDSVRIVGNHLVHPGQLDPSDNKPMAESLFELVNIIAEELITSKKRLKAIYEKLPADAKKAIDDRDKKK
jgi:hypothetical protein